MGSFTWRGEWSKRSSGAGMMVLPGEFGFSNDAEATRSLTLPELLAADAVFLTNSLRLIAPVRAIGGTALASAAHPGLARLIGILRERVAASCAGPDGCGA